MCPGSCDGQPGPREPRVLRFKPLGATAYLAIPYWIKKAFGRYKPSTAFNSSWKVMNKVYGKTDTNLLAQAAQVSIFWSQNFGNLNLEIFHSFDPKTKFDKIR